MKTRRDQRRFHVLPARPGDPVSPHAEQVLYSCAHLTDRKEALFLFCLQGTDLILLSFHKDPEDKPL